jgi:hypothetical protein
MEMAIRKMVPILYLLKIKIKAMEFRVAKTAALATAIV